MRLAVLLCGVLSGIIALGVGWWGQADALLHISGLADPVRVAVILAIQPIALASIAGGAAILVFPAISRAALLASAVGWLGLVAILGGGITLPVGALILLSAGGGLLGFLPSLREPMFRLSRAGSEEEEEEPRSRSAALRYDLRDAVSEPAGQWPQQSPAAPVYQQPPQQVPVQQPAAAVQQPVPLQPPLPPPQPVGVQQPSQQPPSPPAQLPVPNRPRGLTFSSFDTMERPGAALPQQVAPPQPQQPFVPPQPAQPPQSGALPTLGNIAAPATGDGSWHTYFPPPESPTPASTKPPEIKPAIFVPRFDLAEDHSRPFVPAPDDLRDVPVQAIPPPPPPRQPPVRSRKPRTYDFRQDRLPAREPKPVPKRRSKAARRRAAVGIGVLAIVIIGAPALLVLDAQMRGGDAQALPAATAAPSSIGPARSAAASEDVADARLSPGGPLAPTDYTSEVAGDPGSASSSDQFAALPPLSALPSVETISSSAPVADAPAPIAAALPMAPKGPPYASPFDYCTALSNSDTPDATKITGGMPPDIANEVRNAARLSDGDFHWRCMDKAVWVCVTPKGSPACKPVPSAVDRVLFCASHPDVQVTNSPAGDWSCDGFTPVVSKQQLDAVDRRGFDRNVWAKLPGPQLSPSAG